MMLGQDMQSFNAFLSYLKVFHYLSFSPRFTQLTRTLTNAAGSLGGFFVVFMIVMFAASLAHMLCFGAKLEAYGTIGGSMATLLSAMLGEFDFEAVRDAHWLLGPLFFVLYMLIGVFVMLNMFIAIISDAYAETKEELEKETDMDAAQMGEHVRAYIVEGILYRIPIAGPIIKQVHQRAMQAAEKALQVAAAAGAAAGGVAGGMASKAGGVAGGLGGNRLLAMGKSAAGAAAGAAGSAVSASSNINGGMASMGAAFQKNSMKMLKAGSGKFPSGKSRPGNVSSTQTDDSEPAVEESTPPPDAVVPLTKSATSAPDQKSATSPALTVKETSQRATRVSVVPAFGVEMKLDRPSGQEGNLDAFEFKRGESGDGDGAAPEFSNDEVRPLSLPTPTGLEVVPEAISADVETEAGTVAIGSSFDAAALLRRMDALEQQSERVLQAVQQIGQLLAAGGVGSDTDRGASGRPAAGAAAAANLDGVVTQV